MRPLSKFLASRKPIIDGENQCQKNVELKQKTGELVRLGLCPMAFVGDMGANLLVLKFHQDRKKGNQS